MKIVKGLLSIVLSVGLLAGCGATATPSSSGSGASTPTAPTAAKFDKEVDYLVIGAGVAGLSSAIEAADLGIKDILILEKTGKIGGSAFYSDGILSGYDTQITKALGVKVTQDEIYEEQMREKKYILDPELTKLTLEQSGKTINWLIDTLGIKFNNEIIVKDGYGTLPTVHTVEGKGAGMAEFYQKALDDRSAIKLELETSATELIVEDGTVVGAVATTKDGKEVRIGAKAVLIATGGYSANYELFSNLHTPNSVFQTTNFKNQNGDGLVMATNIGAGTQNLDQLQVYLREYNNPTSQYPYMFTIFVGQDGKRFMDEKRTAQTYNQEIKDDVIDLYGRTGVDYFWSIADEASLTQMGIADAAKDHKGILVADTLEELAEKMGADKDAFVSTISTWNQACAKQTDAEFGRTSPMWFPIAKGPFYALQTTFFSSVTHGGLIKNADAQVLRFDGNVIPGLYAAGEVTTVTNSNGYTISNAISFGRIAANHVQKYINGEVVNNAPVPVVEEAAKTRFDMSKKLKDGEYEAAVDGQHGKLTVKTVIKNGAIADVQIVSQNETEDIAKDALVSIPKNIVEKNSVDIDTVSGATMTSERILDAVAACLVSASA
ncbi:MAG: FAD-binding protein [Angelakisella sp.]